MPCFSTCPDGTHHCAMVHEHGGDHAASGCRWADSRPVKRAEVIYNRWGDHDTNGRWLVAIHQGEIPERDRPIRFRGAEEEEGFPTHAAALAHALASVGLTPTNPEEQS